MLRPQPLCLTCLRLCCSESVLQPSLLLCSSCTGQQCQAQLVVESDLTHILGRLGQLRAQAIKKSNNKVTLYNSR